MLKRNARVDTNEITIEMLSRYIERIGPEVNDPRLIAVAKKIDKLFEEESFGRVYRIDEDDGTITFYTHDIDADKLVTERFSQYRGLSLMKKKIIAGMALGFALAGCSAPVQHGRKAAPPVHKKEVKVVHTSDHRYAYQDNSGIWWWYVYSSSNTTSTSITPSPSYISSSNASGLPSGGSWTQGTAPSTTQMAGSVDEEVELEFMADGEPATEAEVEAAEASPTEAAAEAPGAAGEGAAAGGEAGGSAGGGDAGGGGGDGGGGGGD